MTFVPHDPWSPDCPDPLAGTVDPHKAGWDGEPDSWKLHYRVRSPHPVPMSLANKARRQMGERRWEQLNQEWLT